MIKNFASIAGGFITHVSPAEDVWPLPDERVECPDGFGVGDLYDGTTFSKPAPIPLTQEQIDAQAKASKDRADAIAAKADAKLQALSAMNPTQVRAWVAANVSTLADAKDALATLAVCVSILARKL
jgi:hypothetical protein